MRVAMCFGNNEYYNRHVYTLNNKVLNAIYHGGFYYDIYNLQTKGIIYIS